MTGPRAPTLPGSQNPDSTEPTAGIFPAKKGGWGFALCPSCLLLIPCCTLGSHTPALLCPLKDALAACSNKRAEAAPGGKAGIAEGKAAGPWAQLPLGPVGLLPGAPGAVVSLFTAERKGFPASAVHPWLHPQPS